MEQDPEVYELDVSGWERSEDKKTDYESFVSFMAKCRFVDSTKKRAKCPLCDYSNMNKYDFRDHVNVNHIKYAAFACDICNERAFFTEKSRKDHKKRCVRNTAITEVFDPMIMNMNHFDIIDITTTTTITTQKMARVFNPSQTNLPMRNFHFVGRDVVISLHFDTIPPQKEHITHDHHQFGRILQGISQLDPEFHMKSVWILDFRI